MGRIVGVLAAWLMLGCAGGAPDDESPAPERGSSTPNSGSPEPEPSDSGTSDPEDTTWLTAERLDDTFLWMLKQAGMEPEMLQAQGDPNPILHLQLRCDPLQATLVTHHHFNVLKVASRVKFKVKAPQPLQLQVSVFPALDTDYFAARTAGHIWPTRTVDVSTDWVDQDVPFAEMLPRDSITPDAMPSFTLAFIVEAPSSPIDVSLDDVRFE